MMFRIDPKTVPTIDRVANPSVRIKLLGVKERKNDKGGAKYNYIVVLTCV